MGWALYIGGRAPNKILFARDTGRVHQVDFTPVYGDRGTVERLENVPFRLTRNLYAFFTQFGVEGVFMTAMAAAASALVQRNSNLEHVLALFFRDDITAWMAKTRKPPVGGPMLADHGQGRGGQGRGLVGCVGSGYQQHLGTG